MLLFPSSSRSWAWKPTFPSAFLAFFSYPLHCCQQIISFSPFFVPYVSCIHFFLWIWKTHTTLLEYFNSEIWGKRSRACQDKLLSHCERKNNVLTLAWICIQLFINWKKYVHNFKATFFFSLFSFYTSLSLFIFFLSFVYLLKLALLKDTDVNVFTSCHPTGTR